MADFIITNPPWTRDVMHAMIERFAFNCPTWLLFDTDWFYTKQASAFKPYLHKIVSAGRLRFLEGTSEDNGNDPFDNCAWYFFDGSYVTDGTVAY